MSTTLTLSETKMFIYLLFVFYSNFSNVSADFASLSMHVFFSNKIGNGTN